MKSVHLREALHSMPNFLWVFLLIVPNLVGRTAPSLDSLLTMLM